MASFSLIRGCWALALVLGGGAAFAQPSAVSWPNVVLKYATDGTPLLGPRVAFSSTAAGGGAATLNAAQRLAIGNASANLQLTRNVPVANLAKVARVAARALGPLALAGLVYEGVQWLNDSWGYSDPATAWLQVGSTPGCGVLSATGARAYFGSGASYTYFYRAKSHVHYGGQPPVPGAQTYNYCQNPDSTWDALYSLSGQTSAPENEVVPATDEQLEISFQQGLIASPSLAGQVLDAALASSAARAELVADALGITGPATVDGGTKTSTKVETAGTTTIQTATTYNLSYSGDTVTLTQTNVETVTDPGSNVTTTTTTTAAPTGDPPPPEERSKFCEDFPDASACEELGEPEEQPELPSEDRDLSFGQELSDAGSCPAPYALSILGRSYSLEWTPLCDLASGVRPVVIALAWLSAIVFVFAVGSRTT